MQNQRCESESTCRDSVFLPSQWDYLECWLQGTGEKWVEYCVVWEKWDWQNERLQDSDGSFCSLPSAPGSSQAVWLGLGKIDCALSDFDLSYLLRSYTTLRWGQKGPAVIKGRYPPTNDVKKVELDKMRGFASVPETILSLWWLKTCVAKKLFFFIYIRNLSDFRSSDTLITKSQI